MVSLMPAGLGSISYVEREEGHVLVAVVHVANNSDSRFPGPGVRQPRVPGSRCNNSYAEPFLLLIKSVISRFKARFGSKFCGSHACTVSTMVSLYYIYEIGSIVRMKRCSCEVGASPNAP